MGQRRYVNPKTNKPVESHDNKEENRPERVEIEQETLVVQQWRGHRTFHHVVS